MALGEELKQFLRYFRFNLMDGKPKKSFWWHISRESRVNSVTENMGLIIGLTTKFDHCVLAGKMEMPEKNR